MVAAEHKRRLSVPGRRGDELRDAVAELEDRAQKACVGIALVQRFGDGRRDVAEIDGLDPELLDEMLLEPRVPNRRRPHVDPAPARAEIERGADQRDPAVAWLHRHAAKVNVSLLEDQGTAPVRVILADDDEAFVASLRPLIESRPELTVVGTAANGLDAIELTDALLPSAVVIDLHMPVVDGVTAVARMRKDHPQICLIAFTGDADPELHRAVTEAGADAVLMKDDLVETLVDRLGQVTRR
jgi:two-component system vancomycin resistance associated response regulator VraR